MNYDYLDDTMVTKVELSINPFEKKIL